MKQKNVEKIYELTPLQQGMLFHHLYSPESTVYNMQSDFTLEGELDHDALKQSWAYLIERHAVLRTSFAWERIEKPYQVVHRHTANDITYHDLSGVPVEEHKQQIRSIIDEERVCHFNLKQPPLVRLSILTLDKNLYQVVWTFHHIILEGLSINILMSEFWKLYDAFHQHRSPKLPPVKPFSDYINWLKKQDQSKAEAYWRNKLSDFSKPSQLPIDKSSATQMANVVKVESETLVLSQDLNQALRLMAQKNQITMNTVVQGLWAILLSIYSGEEDVVYGTAVSGRPPGLPGADSIIGLFVNTLPVRVKLNIEDRIVPWLQTLQLDQVTMRQYEYSSLMQVKTWSGLPGGQSLFNTMLGFENWLRDFPSEQTISELKISNFRGHKESDQPLTLFAAFDIKAQLTLMYDINRFVKEDIKRMLDHCRVLLEGMAANPNQTISQLPYLSKQEQQQYVKWNQTATDYPRNKTVHELFEIQAATTPDAVAVSYENQELSYAQLNARANQVAHYLQARGVGPEVMAGICVERSLEMVIGLLGILKAGGAYVPLDPDYPQPRLAYMLDDAQVPVLLTTSTLQARLPAFEGQLICLDSDWSAIEQESADNPVVTSTADNLIYVIYTSGSTGRPKGTCIEHHSVVRLVKNTNYIELGPEEVFLQFAPISFDASTLELWGSLLNGAKLVVCPAGKISLKMLGHIIQTNNISTLWLTSALFSQMVDNHLPSLSGIRQLLAGGEALSLPHVQRMLKQLGERRFINGYGPTENTTFTCCHVMTNTSHVKQSVPIGRPISNTTVYILDEKMNPVPVGIPGELYIGGDGLARSYLNQPELTAEKFVANPFSDGSDGRLYRTGDKVRYRSDGAIEFLGRFDHQVKVRGYRIELGEIETTLTKHEAVRDAVVIVREDEPGDKRLVAYTVPTDAWVEQISSSQSGEHVDEWQTLYEETYGKAAADRDPTFNISGWNSSYTGEPIAAEEMREWVEATVARITALEPRRVLEIGCGTGLLLYRLASDCERYVGTDFSAVAQQQVRDMLAARETHRHVELWQRMADDFSGVTAGDFDTVIINSVTQYLPSMDYLVSVVEGAVRAISAGGRIMLGDIRSLPLLKSYHTSVQLYLSPETASVSELLRNVQQHVEEENELVIEPAFFHALKQRIPRLSHVEILLKQGQHHNELSGYRYDVVLHVEATAAPLPASGQWLEWGASQLSETQLHELLADPDQSWLGINAIPNARITRDVAVLEQLEGDSTAKTVGELTQLVESVAQQAVDPAALWRLAEATGYQLELSYTGSGADGRMDALFRRSAREDCAGHVFWPREDTVAECAWNAYGTNPLKGKLAHELIPLLRHDSQEQLPEYMVPSVFVVLDELPLTANGKVDRRALPVPGDVRASLGAEYTAPRSPMEEQLAQIWAEVLKLERVGIHDNFFDLGGHSLMATQVVSRVREQMQIELPLSEMFGYPTVAELAPVLEALSSGGGDSASQAILPVSREGDLPLSFAQERLWFLDQLEPGGTAYNMALALRLKGTLDVAALRASLNYIVMRHEALRTRFAMHQGQPIQIIADDVLIDLPQEDLSTVSSESVENALKARIGEEGLLAFDLSQVPLLRGKLLRLSGHEHVLLLTLHHIVSDGWSLGVLFRELGTCYAAFSAGHEPVLAELPIQYADFAGWQRAWLSGEQLEIQLGYWQERLEGLQTLNLPTDHRRPAIQTFSGGLEGLRLEADLSTQLESLSKQTGVTLFMTLLAAFAVLLHRYSGQDDIVIGSPIANRNRAEVEELIGFFVNMLVMRTDMSSNPSFKTLLEQVQETALGAYQHQDIPFEKLVGVLQPERDRSRNPLFQVQFALQNAPLAPLELQGVTLEPVGAETQVTRFDLECHVWPGNETLDIFFVYNTDLFEVQTIRRMMAHYRNLLQAVIADPQRPIDLLPMLSSDEGYRLLQQWNQTAKSYALDKTLHELLEAQVERTPQAIAVEFNDQTLSYHELDQRANRLAHYLQENGIGADTLAGVFMERSLDMVVALYAILKAGGAYVPLDPEYPSERITYMVEETQVPVLLTQQHLRDRLPHTDAAIICLDSQWDAIANISSTRLSARSTSDDLAYVIYTSGSTGKPKGVMNCHKGIVNRLLWMQETYSLQAEDRVLQKTPFSFDVSVWEFFWPLISGARLVIADPEGHKDPEYLSRLINEKKITTLHFVPSMLKAYLDHADLGFAAHVKRVICSGEALSYELQEQFFQTSDAELHNLYGPTEAAVDVTSWACRRGDERRLVPIGRPVANTRLYILDAQMQAVPVGVPGELHIGGVQVARGYLRRPELTKEKFIADPFTDDPAARLYKTGDLARYLSDGNIEYLGRMDNQVKIRGFRIELGEIEAVIAQYSTVREAAVLYRDDGAQGQRLIAYVVAENTNVPTASELRSFVREHLPNYMVPSAFMVLDGFPLTPNGKLDQRALPTPDGERQSGEVFIEPRSDLERQLADIWCGVLGVDRIGIHDNFFDLGGHSLMATQFVSRVREDLNVELPLSEMFGHPTIGEIAVVVESLSQESSSAEIQAITPLARDDAELPLSFAQERLWFLEQMEPGNPFYNMPLALRLSGKLSVMALQRSIMEIVNRHEALRTHFINLQTGPVQVIDEHFNFKLAQEDLTGIQAEARDAELHARIRQEALQPFDLAQGPLVRGKLLRISEHDHVLLLTIHHIVSDGWSLGVLFKELGNCYAAFSMGQQPELPELPVQYADFAAWQRRWLTGNVLDTQMDYWKERLADLTPLAMPTDRTRPAVQSFRGALLTKILPMALASKLKMLSQQENASLFMVLLAGFAALLQRYSGQDDVVIGAPIANRNRTELEGLIGFFVNSLVMRTDVSGNPDFKHLLARIQKTAVDAYEHQDLPFEKLVEEIQPERDPSRNPLFQVMFTLQNAPMERLELKGLTIRAAEKEILTTRFDLEVHAWEQSGSLIINLFYSTDLFDAETIERMLGHYEALLASIAADPKLRVAELPILSTQEQQQLVEWNQTASEYPREKTVHELFEIQADAAPGALAVVYGDNHLSYRQLNKQANHLAHYLRERGVGAEVKVGLYMERSPEMLIGLLGILKAGGAYVPLDLDYPQPRIAFMLADANVPVLLSMSALQGRLPDFDGELVCLDSDWTAIEQQSADIPGNSVTADNLAYVIYTSGSTGTPKGVEIRHRAINRLVCNTDYYQVDNTDRIAQASNVSFDAATFEIWGALLNGAQLVGIEKDVLLNTKSLTAFLHEQSITAMFITTALFNQISREQAGAFDCLRGLMFGGEAVDPEAVRRVLASQPPQRLIHVYGPTECTTFASWYEIEGVPDDAMTVPIGRPINNTSIYILDEQGQQVPVGVPGELHIGGDGVARGYLNRAQLTAEKFVADPFSDDPQARLYRTGDKVRYLRNGAIEFIGRFDHQVKIRGFRIELGEIETALTQYEAVRDAVVIVREDEPGDKRLVAYTVPTDAWVEQISSSQSGEHVDEWQALYEETYGNTPKELDPTFNITGWNSSYTGEPIAAEEMREWVEATVARITALEPRRVLEIGCGTGLLLYRLASDCERYVGTDFSAVAQQQVRDMLAARETHRHVELWQRMADDFSGVTAGDFDTVIINSVTQYLPSMDYLVSVVEGAVRAISAGGRIMLGDIRSLPLLKSYHTSVQLYLSPETASVSELLRNVQQHVEEENELVIEPAFFHALKQRIPRLSHVEILLKQGQHHNELSGYRYDVVLHVEATAAPLPASGQWLEWGASQLSETQLHELLADPDQSWLGINAIPNARITRDVAVLEQLEGDSTAKTVGELTQLVESVAQQAVDPAALWRLAEATGYQLELSYTGSGADGRMDALFRRSAREDCAGHVFWPREDTVAECAWNAYGTNPLKGKLAHELIPLLRHDSQEQLPEYMVPSVFVVLDELPLTANGKVDRRALPVPGDVRASLGAEYTAPRSPMEEQLAQIWAEVLKLERVGIHDNFFDLGGHSLMATQVVSRVREQMQIELPLSEMFGYPTVAELAPVVETLVKKRTGSSVQAIKPVARDVGIPLSFAQERLWFLDQLEPGNVAYNIPLALRLTGNLNVEALLNSFDAIVHRHEVLRTHFANTPHGPVQVIEDEIPFELSHTNLSDIPIASRHRELIDRLRAEAIRPFDLANDPLVRGSLLRLSEHEHILLLTMHHIISDGWSLGVLFRELGDCYAAFSTGQQPKLSELPIQYADFAVWQREWLSGKELETQLDYWKQQLSELTTLALPTDHPRSPMQTYAGAHETLSLGSQLSDKLESLSKQSGVTLFMTLLSAYMVMLHRYSGQNDIVIGSPIANRNRSELEGLIAFFVNMLVMRVDSSGNPSFKECVKRVSATALAAYEHQDIPFEKLVDVVQIDRDPSRNPLFQVHFAVQNAPLEPLNLQGLTLEPVNSETQVTRFDLECHVWTKENELQVYFIYNTDLFDATTIRRMLEHYRVLLGSVVAEPDLPIDLLPMLSTDEKHLLLEQWNQTVKSYALDKTLHQLFETQVELTPHAVAIEHNDQTLSYHELDERANRLACYLQENNVGPGTLVGVFMDRSLDMVVALYGILKAGGAYVPLDPEYPQERIAFMVEETQVPVLLTQQHLQDQLPNNKASIVCLDTQWDAIANISSTQLSSRSTSEDLAYVIYTSGSTGKPKGVMNCHKGIVNRLLWMQERYNLQAEDRVLQKTPFSFDVSVWEFFWPLISGACLVIADPGGHKDPEYLSILINEKKITTLHFVPSMLKAYLDHTDLGAATHVKRVICSGEELSYELQEQFFKASSAELHNLYGPTEAAVDVTSWACRRGDERRVVPIGRPIANTRLYILGPQMQAVPIGVPGELHIGGVQVARGYLERPELTKEMFVDDPFSEDPAARLYKTGDLARYLPDGNIEYLGRMDNQIKLRGFRIELGEIETALKSHEAVNDAVVTMREDVPGDQRLVAYTVPDQAWVEQMSTSQSGEHVEEWQALYEETYGNVTADHDPTFNIISWNSSYSGEPIPAEEMREWVEATVACITAFEPRRVLEIGCGTGLLLYRLAPGCERYVGTDFSAVAQQQVHDMVSSRDTHRHVELWQRMANDFSGVEASEFDTVIINSVAQYLPGMDYLAEVLAGAVDAVSAGGRVFVGDVRSYPLLKPYHTSVELHRSADNANCKELLTSIQQHVEEENELVIEPAFFHALKQRFPRLSHVEVLLKHGTYHNELSSYRYDVVLHVEAASEALPVAGRWLEWGKEHLSEVRLRQALAEGDLAWLGVRGIPNARVAQEIALLEQLEAEGTPETAGELRKLIESMVQHPVEPSALWELAADMSYALELSYTDSGADGRMDALFRRHGREECFGNIYWPQDESVPERPWNAYGTNPLKGKLGRALIPRLRDDIKLRLPEYMAPSVFVMLDALPLSPNGKVDRRALPMPGNVRAGLGTEYTAPRTELEEQLVQIWIEVLKLERVGVHDNFFDLGGHSLMATQVVSRLRETLDVELPLSEMFGYPTVAKLAEKIEMINWSNQEVDDKELDELEVFRL